jgi:hypothetical protein
MKERCLWALDVSAAILLKYITDSESRPRQFGDLRRVTPE